MIGLTVSHYRILEKLGGGGMGIVYKAHDLKLDRHVALKFLPPAATSDPDARQRFALEARAASALQHDNICTIHDIDETEDGQSFIVMDLYDGETLKSRIERGPVPPEETARIALQIIDGLTCAHDAGIVHRDIKPGNIIITSRGEAKILDFGLAKLSGQSAVTRSGSTLGTAAYMSPEQARGEPTDARTDIWSFGVVLHEMLTGKRPFRGDYEQVVIYSILNQDPPPIEGAEVGPLASIVTRCLAKDPGQRFQTALEASEALLDAAPWLRRHGSSSARQPLRYGGRLSRMVRRPAVIALLVVAALALIAPVRQTFLRWIGLGERAGETHLAILADPANQAGEALCVGIVDVLTERIARLHKTDPSLWVIPASEIQKEKVATASDARKYFGATHALSVRARRTEAGFRLTLNLIDAITLRQLDSEEVDETPESLRSLESRAQQMAADLLGVSWSPTRGGTPAARVPTPEAYDFYLQGRGYLKRYDRSENVAFAIEMFRAALGADSAFTLARAGLAEAYWRRFESGKDTQWVRLAREECARALAGGTESSEIHATAGLICNGTGDYTRAKAEFIRAVELDPENADAVRGLGSTYDLLQEPAQAEACFRQAITLQPGSWVSHNTLGRFLSRHGRYEEAVDAMKHVIALTPNNTRGYNNLGGIYLFLGRYVDADSVLKQSIAIQPTYAALSNLGTSLYKQRRFADAAASYRAALSLNDRDYVMWGNLASSYLLAPGKRDSAIATYRRAIDKAQESLGVNPQDAGVLASLAAYYSDIGSHRLAVETMDKALAIAPQEGEILYRAGCMYEVMGNRTRALEYLGEALKRGYARSEIETYPGLDDLRKDQRYAALAKGR